MADHTRFEHTRTENGILFQVPPAGFHVNAFQVTMAKMDLDGFRQHLLDRGRDPGTVKLYCDDLRVLFRDYDEPQLGIVDRDLAPATRRHRLAALRAWADFQGDSDLFMATRQVRLPYPRRVKPKVPLSRAAGRARCHVVDDEPLEPAVCGVIGMMAVRGFRASDVLRIRRVEVRQALKTGTLGFEAKGERRMEFRTRHFERYLRIIHDFGDGKRWNRVEDLVSPRSDPRKRRASAARKVERALKRCARQVGLDDDDVHPHRLRRTYATFFLHEVGNDPQALQKLQSHMQWADLSTAAGYVDYIRQEELDEVADRLMEKRD